MAQATNYDHAGVNVDLTSRANLGDKVYFSELSQEEKSLLNSEDYPIISVVNGLSSDDLEGLYDSFVPLFSGDYIRKEVGWFKDLENNIKNVNGGKLDTDEEIRQVSRESARYKVYMALKYEMEKGCGELKDSTPVVSKQELTDHQNSLVKNVYQSLDYALQRYS